MPIIDSSKISDEQKLNEKREKLSRISKQIDKVRAKERGKKWEREKER